MYILYNGLWLSSTWLQLILRSWSTTESNLMYATNSIGRVFVYFYLSSKQTKNISLPFSILYKSNKILTQIYWSMSSIKYTCFSLLADIINYFLCRIKIKVEISINLYIVNRTVWNGNRMCFSFTKVTRASQRKWFIVFSQDIKCLR